MSCFGTSLSFLILFLWEKYSSNYNPLNFEDFEHNLAVKSEVLTSQTRALSVVSFQ